MLASGELDGMSLVWREGMAQWTELGQVGELRAILLRADPDDDDDKLPAEQQVFDPHDDLDAARREAAAAKAKQPKGGGRGAGEAGAPAEAAGASADGEAKAKRVRKKKPKFKTDGGSSIYVSGLPDDAE